MHVKSRKTSDALDRDENVIEYHDTRLAADGEYGQIVRKASPNPWLII